MECQQTDKTCRDCDWADSSPDESALICTLNFNDWKEVDPDQLACGDFVRMEE